MIYENIRKLCRRAGISISCLEREAGLGKGTVYSWKTSEPAVYKLKRVADRFGLALDALLEPLPEEA